MPCVVHGAQKLDYLGKQSQYELSVKLTLTGMFWQDRWRAAQQGSEADGAPPMDSTLLLRVIATSAARFPPAEAASLAKDLLKARLPILLRPRPLACRATQMVLSNLQPRTASNT